MVHHLFRWCTIYIGGVCKAVALKVALCKVEGSIPRKFAAAVDRDPGSPTPAVKSPGIKSGTDDAVSLRMPGWTVGFTAHWLVGAVLDGNGYGYDSGAVSWSKSTRDA